ncbi:MAG: alpha/beta fold hydrolase [Deltaproteobacteria bacterium]|nr:alpha/beta fold hydrolase [Deltaproteobacteria bacterium]
MPIKIFIHGLESNNQGTKSLFFKDKFPDMVIPNFPGDLQARMEKLEDILAGKSGIRLVGSSFGGLMGALFALKYQSRIEKMVLLAPAIHKLGPEICRGKKISIPVFIYHGNADEIIPLEGVKSAAEKIFTNLSFHEVDDDHSLHKTFKGIDWDSLLRLC